MQMAGWPGEFLPYLPQIRGSFSRVWGVFLPGFYPRIHPRVFGSLAFGFLFGFWSYGMAKARSPKRATKKSSPVAVQDSPVPAPEPGPEPIFDPPAPEVTPNKQALANRRNSALSTGPRTPEGKAVVARNRITHGIRSPQPVVTSSETLETWEVHRTTVVADLAPIGAVELALAERVAQLLWRLGRVVDFETTAINDSQANAPQDIRFAAIPFPQIQEKLVLPEEESFMAWATAPVTHLENVVEKLASKRAKFARLERKVVFLEAFPTTPPAHEVDGSPARALINEIREYLPPGKVYEWEAPDAWTAAALHERLAAVCEVGQWSVELTIKTVLEDWRKDRDAVLNEIVELTKDELRMQGVIQRGEQQLTRRRGLPGVQQAEAIQKYESHLDRALARALGQLHQLQALRAARQSVRDWGRDDADRRGGGIPTLIVGLVNRGGGAEMGLNGGNGGLAIEDGR